LGLRDRVSVGSELTVVCQKFPVVDPRDASDVLGYEECTLRVSQVSEETCDAEIVADQSATPSEGDKVRLTPQGSSMIEAGPVTTPNAGSRGYGEYDPKATGTVEERGTARAEFEKRRGGAGRGLERSGVNRGSILKEFDKNGDGQLDQQEAKAAAAKIREKRGLRPR
jgi:hypothetical protein